MVHHIPPLPRIVHHTPQPPHTVHHIVQLQLTTPQQVTRHLHLIAQQQPIIPTQYGILVVLR